MTNPMAGPGGMGMGGPSGTWTSRKTGDNVIVRDTIIENDHIMVMLSDGRMIPMGVFSKEYIQISDEVYDKNGKSLGKQAQQTPVQEESKPTVNESLLFKGMGDAPKDEVSKKVAEDEAKKAASLAPIMDIGTPVEQATTNTKEIEMVNKVLEKVRKPKIKFNVTWTEFPKDELNMLRKYFDIKNSDITEAIIKKYLDQNSLRDEMQKTIENLLEKK